MIRDKETIRPVDYWLKKWERRGDAQRLIGTIQGKRMGIFQEEIAKQDAPNIVEALLILKAQYEKEPGREPWNPSASRLEEYCIDIANQENSFWHHLTPEQQSTLIIISALR